VRSHEDSIATIIVFWPETADLKRARELIFLAAAASDHRDA